MARQHSPPISTRSVPLTGMQARKLLEETPPSIPEGEFVKVLHNRVVDARPDLVSGCQFTLGETPKDGSLRIFACRFDALVTDSYKGIRQNLSASAAHVDKKRAKNIACYVWLKKLESLEVYPEMVSWEAMSDDPRPLHSTH